MTRFVPIALLLLLLVPAQVTLGEEPAAPQTTRATVPTEVISLFNGKDLEGWYSYLADTKYEDPKQIFSVHDGLLHISGDGFGYLCTKQLYTQYHLVCEFKWGTRTWQSRKEATRDSGILVHCTGPDGSSGTWMASIEFQLIEGGIGDFIVVGGNYADGKPIPVTLTAEVTEDRDGETVWHKGGEKRVFTSGRVNWYGRDPDWKDVLGFRGKDDVESVSGEWNRVEVICRGNTITNLVNGVVVNEGQEAFPSAGKILIQTEGAELFVRKFELHPLSPE